MEVKRECGIATRRFHRKHRGRNRQFFLSILVAYRLFILQGYPIKHFSKTRCSLNHVNEHQVTKAHCPCTCYFYLMLWTNLWVSAGG